MQKLRKIKQSVCAVLSLVLAAGSACVPASASAPVPVQDIQMTAKGTEAGMEFTISAGLVNASGGQDFSAENTAGLASLTAGLASLTAGLDRFVFTSESGKSRFLKEGEVQITKISIPEEEIERDYQIYTSMTLDGADDYETSASYENSTGHAAVYSFARPVSRIYLEHWDVSRPVMFRVTAKFNVKESGTVTAYSHIMDQQGVSKASEFPGTLMKAEISALDEATLKGSFSRAAVTVPVRETSISSYGRLTGNTLNGWTVTAKWKDGTRNYSWNAVEDETRKPTVIVEYRHENADRDYAPGDLVIQIPDFGSARRTGTYPVETSAGTGLSEWESSYDSVSDTRIFKNKFAVQKGQSVTGGFELAWKMNARETEHGCSLIENPYFTIGNSILALPELSFAFTSTKDQYRIGFDYDQNDKSYIVFDGSDSYEWNGAAMKYDRDHFSRGLKEWKNTFTITLPEAVSVSDMKVFINGTDWTGNLKKQSDKAYSCEISGTDEILAQSTEIHIGVKKDVLEGKTVTVDSHLDRLYLDDGAWTVSALNENEDVDDSISMTLYIYNFTWKGQIYNTEKVTNGGYEAAGKKEPAREKMLPAQELFHGRKITFTVAGFAANGFAPTGTLTRRTTDPVIPADAVLAAPGGKTYKELHRESSGNTSGISQIKMGDDWYMFLGDDRLALAANDGTIRNLTDAEYDIRAVRMYSRVLNCRFSEWELYGAKTQDTPFGNYELLASGTKDNETVILPDGYKAVFSLLKNNTGFNPDAQRAQCMDVTAVFHLDWEMEKQKPEEKQIDPDGYIANFGYFRPMCQREDGSLANDAAQAEANYEGNYGSVLALRDHSLYGEYFMRDYAHIYLRELPVHYYVYSELSGPEEISGETSYKITAKAMIKPDEKGLSAREFTVYSEIPDGLSVSQISLDDLDFATDAYKSAAEASLVRRNGKDYVAVRYAFTGIVGPLQMFPTLRDFSFSYTAVEKEPKTRQYVSYTYLFMDDSDGPLAITGTVMDDHYDLDGDGDTSETIGYGADVLFVQDGLTEWRQYVEKHVKSFLSQSYIKSTETEIYDVSMTPEEQERAEYSYRLTFALGANAAKKIVLYDRIEQGARIADHEGGGYKDEESAWQGSLLGVDTSQAEMLGLKTSVYYSENPDQPFDLTDAGWMVSPPDMARVKSVAVALDASSLEGGIFTGKNAVSAEIRMRAPSDITKAGSYAVNQYTAVYDSCDPATGASLEKTYTLPSSATYVLLNHAPLCELVIDKALMERYEPYGNGDFIFEVLCTEGKDKGKRFIRAISMTDQKEPETGYFFGTSVITGLYPGTYKVREIGGSRYRLMKTEEVENITVSGLSGSAVLSGSSPSAEIRFTNGIEKWNKESHEAITVNEIKTSQE